MQELIQEWTDRLKSLNNNLDLGADSTLNPEFSPINKRHKFSHMHRKFSEKLQRKTKRNKQKPQTMCKMHMFEKKAISLETTVA